MTRSEQEFRAFVAVFADPLARLAFLLSAGTSLDPTEMTLSALAAVRRQWRDVETTGAPEPLAVQALVLGLPRPRRSVLTRPVAAAVPAMDLEDDELLRTAAWDAWVRLTPRLRLPLLLDDLSVASPRLAEIEVAQSARSARRAAVVSDDVWRHLREAIVGDRRWAHSQIESLMRDALRAQAAAVPALIDPSALVVRRVSRMRLRASGTVAASLLVVVAAGAVAVVASTPKKDRIPPLSSLVVADSVSDRGPVVAWPTRGTAAHNSPLITKLKAAFLHAHPETTGQVQVLLVTDTSTYRIAYVTAKSPTGVLESWFYGPVGSDDLVEGVVRYGGGLDARTEMLATGLADAQGHTQLVVLAPPGTGTMRLTTGAASASTALREANGVAVREVPTGTIASLSLDVRIGQTHVVSKELRTLALGPTFEGASAPFEPQAAPSFSAERGAPDPQVLAQAAYDAELWAMQDGAANRVQMKVLWGGTDAVGNRMVVVRMKMELSDMLLVTWDDQNDVPRQTTEDFAAPSTPDAPLAFSYLGSGDPRIAVLGATGDRSAVLTFRGRSLPAVPLDGTGFASFRVADVSWLSSPGLAVNLLGAAGNVVKTIPIPAL